MKHLFIGWLIAVVVVCGGFTVVHAICPAFLGDAPPPHWTQPVP